MSTLFTLTQFKKKILELPNDQSLGLFKHQWYVEMDGPNNLCPYLYLLCFNEEGIHLEMEYWNIQMSLLSNYVLNLMLSIHIRVPSCKLIFKF